MNSEPRKKTVSEFLQLPTSNLNHELINGLESGPRSQTGTHQRALLRRAMLVTRLVRNGEVFVAPVDVYFDDFNIVQPDVLWVAEGSKCTWFEDKYLQGAPDLVVEIFSPGSLRRDRKDKFRLYEKSGVREYWMIDAGEKLLEIWQLQDGRFVLIDVFGPGDPCKSPLLGEVDVKAIFQNGA
jgi:Uma2 family endonuclease